jgi:hypothetical protein
VADRLAALEVRGRRSSRLISFPVVVADYQGERYLVAMLGEGTNWVHNVRAAGGAMLRHGRAKRSASRRSIGATARRSCAATCKSRREPARTFRLTDEHR